MEKLCNFIIISRNEVKNKINSEPQNKPMYLQVIDFQHKCKEYKLDKKTTFLIDIRPDRNPHTEILNCTLSQHTAKTT